MRPTLILFFPALLLFFNEIEANCRVSSENGYVCDVGSIRKFALDETEVRSVVINCDDNEVGSNFDSYTRLELVSRWFVDPAKLVSLALNKCQVAQVVDHAFVDLVNLRKLALNNNQDLRFSSKALADLTLLEEINLDGNKLNSLPNGLLCNVPNLVSLLLVNNQLQHLDDVGLLQDFGHCSLQLRSLDLSRNEIASDDDQGLKALQNTLKKLTLRSNHIAKFDVKHLNNLQDLDLGNNELTIMPELNNNTKSLQKLLVDHNALTALTFDSVLNELLVLNASHNTISELDAAVFGNLNKLRVLDLSHNNLKVIKKNVFNHLSQLVVLRLEHNRIVDLNEFNVDKLEMLETLSLAHNQIHTLSETLILPSNLLTLELDNNELIDLPSNLFKKSSSLSSLSLSSNRLRRVPSSISSLYKLRTLDLGENIIEELNNDDFGSNMSELYGLRLSGNALSTLSNSSLRHLKGLHVLNLSGNRLRSIDQGTLDALTSLRALRLDDNELTDINGVVSSLPSLKWFNVSSNALQWFDYAFLPLSVEWLDVHDNEIDALGNYFGLNNGLKLAFVDAAHNRIASLDNASVPQNLETLLLNHNRIENIHKNAFIKDRTSNRISLKRLDLRSNRLTQMPRELFKPRDSKIIQQDLKLSLSRNPLVCTCDLAWLKTTNSEPNHIHVDDLDLIQCQSSTSTRSLSFLKSSSLLCSYTSYCAPSCQCCDFYACDCRLECPRGCNCRHDDLWTINSISCSNRGHTTLPLLLPMDATEVFMDGNNLSLIETQSFIGRRRIEALYLNNSNIRAISPFSFVGLEQGLRKLHLEHNEIAAIDPRLLENLARLEELYLQHNLIESLNVNVFKSLRRLRVLRLDRNKLANLDFWQVFSAKSALQTVSLSNNPWQCECRFWRTVHSALTRGRIVDSSSIVCVGEDGQERRLERDLCNNAIVDELLVLSEDNKQGTALATSSSTSLMGGQGLLQLSALLLSVLMAALLLLLLSTCLCRKRIKDWLYSKSAEIYDHSGCTSNSTMSAASTMYCAGPSLTASNSPKLFDIYVSYSSLDSKFVQETLAPALESCSFKLCLHQRDFPAQACLFDTVSVATESSARVLVVLTKAYLECEWPHVSLPLRNSLGQQRHKLAFLTLDEQVMDLASKSADLRQCLKSSPSVNWINENLSMSRLRLFLPEPAFQTFQRNVNLRTMQPTHLRSLAASKEMAKSVLLSDYSDRSTLHNGVVQLPSPNNSLSTQSTHMEPSEALRNRLNHVGNTLGNNVGNNSASVSLYSHHTYQSISELAGQRQKSSNPIYHTLEPETAENRRTVFIDNDLVLQENDDNDNSLCDSLEDDNKTHEYVV